MEGVAATVPPERVVDDVGRREQPGPADGHVHELPRLQREHHRRLVADFCSVGACTIPVLPRTSRPPPVRRRSSSSVTSPTTSSPATGYERRALSRPCSMSPTTGRPDRGDGSRTPASAGTASTTSGSACWPTPSNRLVRSAAHLDTHPALIGVPRAGPQLSNRGFLWPVT